MGTFASQQQSFASHIAYCSKCGATFETITFDQKTGACKLWSCGHAADLVVRPNPLLDVQAS